MGMHVAQARENSKPMRINVVCAWAMRCYAFNIRAIDYDINGLTVK